VEVELLNQEGKTATFVPLLVIDGDKTTVGTPEVSHIKVLADVVEQDVKADKVTAIRYKAKKRVHKVRGHRQHHAVLKIKSIA
jgi:large subunit ribosomal protein L21